MIGVSTDVTCHSKNIITDCFYIYRSPESAKIKQKMVYTSSKDYLKRCLVGIGKEFQACDHGDLCWSGILETLLRMEVAQ